MQQQQVEWRRAKVMELLSKGESNQPEIACMSVSMRSNYFQRVANRHMTGSDPPNL
jgi:hypothetical protein